MFNQTTRYIACLSVAAALSATTEAGSMPADDARLVPAPLERYWHESLSGGPPKDGIPSIDDPRFESADQADRWLDEGDRIIGIHRNGQARAYPQSILVWHEIVNDTINGENIAITYCPLTGTALGFERGEDELGVSGRLVNSNLIMYNRANDTYWPQILAAGIHGPQTGESLREARVVWTTWDRWKERHPDTEVLSRRTGHARNYRRDPYGNYNPRSGYYADRGTLFPLFARSDRFHEKHEVFGFRTANEAVAVEPSVLAEAGRLRFAGEQHDFLILHDAGLNTAWVFRGDKGGLPSDEALGDLEFTTSGPAGPALEGLTPVNGFEAMWFAWHAFYPETVVIDELD